MDKADMVFLGIIVIVVLVIIWALPEPSSEILNTGNVELGYCSETIFQFEPSRSHEKWDIKYSVFVEERVDGKIVNVVRLDTLQRCTRGYWYSEPLQEYVEDDDCVTIYPTYSQRHCRFNEYPNIIPYFYLACPDERVALFREHMWYDFATEYIYVPVCEIKEGG